MIRTQEATGKTVDEARINACALLGVEKDDINVSYEVLEMPQKTGFLGLKLTPAKVRVSVELPDEPVAAPAAPAAAPAEGMGNDLAYFNNNAVWRRADLTTDAGRAFFDTMVSGDIDAIASSDYFAVQGRATNPKALQIIELLWAAKGTGTQNSNQRVLTARRKSAEINLSEVYELLARYRDANPNTAPRPVKK